MLLDLGEDLDDEIDLKPYPEDAYKGENGVFSEMLITVSPLCEKESLDVKEAESKNFQLV